MFCFESALNLHFSVRKGTDCRCVRVTTVLEETDGLVTEKVILWGKYASNFTVNTSQIRAGVALSPSTLAIRQQNKVQCPAKSRQKAGISHKLYPHAKPFNHDSDHFTPSTDGTENAWNCTSTSPCLYSVVFSQAKEEAFTFL